jgi:UDP-N-acetyl-D-glucosamine dehydrogenase
VPGETYPFFSKNENAGGRPSVVDNDLLRGKMSKLYKQQLIRQINDRTARVAILGLGYVGLPLAVVFAEAGFSVIGIDPDTDKIEKIGRGVSYIQDVSTEQLANLVASGYK